MAAYADDLLFFLSKPEESVHELMQEVIRYGKISNFKINLEKLVILPSHVPLPIIKSLQDRYSFLWNRESLCYLGVHIAADEKILYERNYETLITEIMKDLNRWKGNTLTWFGRINTLKMNMVPRLLYILYTVPIQLPQIFFKKIRKAFI